jgi:hypothetical protein
LVVTSVRLNGIDVMNKDNHLRSGPASRRTRSRTETSIGSR